MLRNRHLVLVRPYGACRSSFSKRRAHVIGNNNVGLPYQVPVSESLCLNELPLTA